MTQVEIVENIVAQVEIVENIVAQVEIHQFEQFLLLTQGFHLLQRRQKASVCRKWLKT